MKYILMGMLDRDWIGRHKERVEESMAKAKEFGIEFESIYYTQGQYDFIDIIEASDPYVVLAFSMWYAKNGYGRIMTMPAFDEPTIERVDDMTI
ncbi:MAG: GYD domain-containing protein [Rhodospirillales bacterium]|nr:GYD domain-containing protein [Rhodospirillales bacterium]